MEAINYTELLKTQVVVHAPNADWTPKGKRSYRVVKTAKNGRSMRQAIAWYVGGKLYRYLPINVQNIAMSQEWAHS